MKLMLGLLIGLCGVPAARSEVITSCSEPEGYTYYAEAGVVSKAQSGWTKDGITGGRYVLVRYEGKYDILFTDATKRTLGTREDGGEIIEVTDKPGTLVLLVVYPEMSVETWTFKLDESGAGSVVMSQQRYGESALIQKYALFRAGCAKYPVTKATP